MFSCLFNLVRIWLSTFYRPKPEIKTNILKTISHISHEAWMQHQAPPKPEVKLVILKLHESLSLGCQVTLSPSHLLFNHHGNRIKNKRVALQAELWVVFLRIDWKGCVINADAGATSSLRKGTITVTNMRRSEFLFKVLCSVLLQAAAG